MKQTYSCDGSCYRSDCLEVRVLPTSGFSNAILCRQCFTKEIEYRRLRNKGYLNVPPVCNPWDLPKWEELKIYEYGE